MSKQPRDEEYLRHVTEAISRISCYLKGKTETDFLRDSLLQDAVIRNLEIVGEAVSKLSSQLKEQGKGIP